MARASHGEDIIMQSSPPPDPETHSSSSVTDNIAYLKSLFPEAFAQGKIDFSVLRQLLGDVVDDGEEKYGLNWHGKRRARRLALAPSTGTLRPCPQESVDWHTTQNLMIEGDNLEVLKLLQKSYAGKVKLIYVDPPFNTGKEFVYPDDYKDGIKHYLKITSQLDDNWKKISSNPETSGRFHTDWLNMMYPRIKIARNLLSEDGVMFISIDDGELSGLRHICDEIFAEANRIGIICHKSRASVSNDKIISSNHNFILVYAKNEQNIFERRQEFGLTPVLEGFDQEDDKGQFKYVPVDGPGGSTKANPYYSFLGVTGHWRFSKERMQRMYEQGLVKKVGAGLQQKYYLTDAERSRKTDTTWWDNKFYTSTASSRLKSLMGGESFNNPKPVELIERMLELWVREPGDIVVDFFAGSGTTAHAVMLHNNKHNTTVRYMVVQLPWHLDPKSKGEKPAADLCDKLSLSRNIAELTRERLRRAAKQIKDGSPDCGVDLGFRVYKLDSSNIRSWEPNRNALEQSLLEHLDNIKEDRSEQDILHELLLKRGLDLCTPIETRDFDDRRVYAVADGALLACLTEQIGVDDVEELATHIADWVDDLESTGDITVVFRDSAFADDVAKINCSEILRQRGIKNVQSI